MGLKVYGFKSLKGYGFLTEITEITEFFTIVLLRFWGAEVLRCWGSEGYSLRGKVFIYDARYFCLQECLKILKYI